MSPHGELHGTCFEQRAPAFGRMRLRPVCDGDLPLLHSWVSQEYARFWGMVGQSLEQVTLAYRELRQRCQVYLGYLEEMPLFLLEVYDPARDEIAKHYEVQPGDRGMHVLLAPPKVQRSGLSWAVFDSVMSFLFQDPRVERVVVEPDVRNTKIHKLNRRAGFRYEKLVVLPHKTAHLALCSRAQFERARSGGSGPSPALQATSWHYANLQLATKILSEFAHELLIEPRRISQAAAWQTYELVPLGGSVRYTFQARRLPLDHWDIRARSLLRYVADTLQPIDALALVVELAEQVGLSPEVLPTYLEELASTLRGDAEKHARERVTAGDLVHASFQEIEYSMTAGHPIFAANSGKLGFSAADCQAYAPESGAPFTLVWLAAARAHTEVHACEGLPYKALLARELSAEALARFQAQLRRLQRDPEAYVFIPVHPWQWANKLPYLFADELARGDLVYLGPSDDIYQAQQSIRTCANLSLPERCYVKMALSVLNMGFMRGLSPDYMQATPAINDYIHALLQADPYFARQNFGILREIASVGYRSQLLDVALPKLSPYRKLLSALWRESPVRYLAPGQRLMTMAALLHRDASGRALLPQLIGASRLSIDAWLDRYLDAFFAPLLHCFYRYELAFMPHGENVILVLEDHVVTGVWIKDIGEEAAIMSSERALPKQVARLGVTVPEDMKLLSIFTDVFDGYFRFLSQILYEQADYAPESFWRAVARCAHAYQADHPELAQQFERYDLFTPQFARSCLNRLQLRNNRQMVDLSDPAGQLQLIGVLDNPIVR